MKYIIFLFIVCCVMIGGVILFIAPHERSKEGITNNNNYNVISTNDGGLVSFYFSENSAFVHGRQMSKMYVIVGQIDTIQTQLYTREIIDVILKKNVPRSLLLSFQMTRAYVT